MAGAEKFGNVTQYADGLKIDFTLLPIKWIQQIVQSQKLPAELDAGFRILLDKDQLAEGMPSPTYTAYIPTQPTDEMFQTAVNDFFSDPPYVAKCLLRNELLPVKWCLDYDMKHVYLRQMLEWKVGADHNWSVAVGALGKGLKKQLPAELWSQFEATYAGADVAENWDALFRTMELYRQVAMDVGERLGYAYPLDLDQRVTEYVQGMRREYKEYEGN
jgi:aminoglycoside 6-adenylyltransferase